MAGIAETEFEVEDIKYRAGRLGAFDQFTVASKLGGVIALVLSMRARDEVTKLTEDNFITAFAAMSGDLRKSDADLVLGLCLGVVKRDQGGDRGFAPIMVEGRPVFQDIDMKPMLQIVWRVLVQHRIVDFFSEPRSTSSGPGTDQKSS